MHRSERQQEILDRARASGRVDVRELSQTLAVAPETVRRDLAVLERRGKVRRVSGSAFPVDGVAFRASADRPVTQRAEQKQRIAVAAIPLLAKVESVYLDEGTTVAELAALIRPARELTVITSSLPIATNLIRRPNVTVIMLGGRAKEGTLSVADHWATDMLAAMVIDLAFIGTNGISGRGLSCPNAATAAVKTAAIRASRQTVALADRTKLGTESFIIFAPLEEIDMLITDAEPPSNLAGTLRSSGLRLLHA